MPRGPLSAEAKAALLKRLADGRTKIKAARAEAKEKGLSDPKPRKPRAKKNGNAEPLDKKEAVDPTAHPAAREDTRPISGAKDGATNAVAAMPPNPEETKSSKIDVPNLPDKKSRKRIVKDAEVLPESKNPKDLSSTGRTKGDDVNDLIVNKESGNQAIPAQYPGQKESIKKLLKKNKEQDKPLAPSAVPNPEEKTTKSVIKHVADVKAIEARAPFSFSAVRKMLYQ
jgi:hypothetical protein